MSSDQDKLALGRKRAEEFGLWQIPLKWPMTAYDWSHAYNADDIHRLLSGGAEVFDCDSDRWGTKWTSSKRQGLLIGIRPLEKPKEESEERKLLKTIVNCFNQVDKGPFNNDFYSAVSDAIELLKDEFRRDDGPS